MCCCCNQHRHHAHGGRECGSHHQKCGEKGHPETNLHQVLQNLQDRVQAVEEQLASEQEAA